VHTTGSADGQVESVILFQFLSWIAVNSESEARRLAGEQSLIGLPEYQHNAKTFLREWGTDAGQTELVKIVEKVHAHEEFYTVQHHSMLYARETGLPNRREFLLFSMEEAEDGAISLSTSIGISLYSSDLLVI
jgi:GGDEF domain-containing protein